MANISKLLSIFIILGILSLGQILSMNDDDSDPYEAIRYNMVFDQTKLYEQYQELLCKLGCFNNVKSQKALCEQNSNPLELIQDDHNVIDPEELEKYKQACLQLLNQEQFWIIVRPGWRALLDMMSTSMVAYTTRSLATQNSLGASLALLTALSNMVQKIPTVCSALYSVAYPPDNPLSDLEKHFAVNKCYIPSALWPKIINAFVLGRRQASENDTHVKFLKFALNFTTYKPKAAIQFKNNMSVDQVKDELGKRIDTFFNDYENMDESLWHIKINLAKFIDSIVENKRDAEMVPCYLYLQGMGGIGKTHFVQTLFIWLEELMPKMIQFEDHVVHSADELEGNEDRPGVLLRVLRNQLMKNRRGSIVIFDEACWVNDSCMIPAVKRTFNGDQSKISTSYFGSNIDGTDVTLCIPPMFSILASNSKIEDEALASRFPVVSYPIPKTQTLIGYALKTARQSDFLKQKKCLIDEKCIATWVQDLEENNHNFRYVAKNVEPRLLSNQK